ncbi:hypothetical protein I3215_31840 [Streptomyces sp. RB110-1]|uniref:hypothetical protein n=1 Tax=unclassified Streptomyces TaxID=2593676 RepID=UPI0019028B98|nr:MULTISPECIES: hypothetical protein [unclassified Streptomyces]MBK0377407.1 hypothetical protein [Streptomyces sp. RB110-1]MBK0386221.1 hypothetical protein [Streptomyces sp. RB110-2]
MTRHPRLGRLAAGIATATVLCVTASGCVTVHGELAVVPAAKKSEAARALKEFTDAYNAADKAYDPALNADRVTGPLGAINQAGLKARRSYNPDGNKRHQPLVLDDAAYVIPKKAGWPRWFLANTDSNRDEDGGKLDTRWLVVFVRSGPDAPWKAAYLTVVPPSQVPEFTVDGDGFATPVEPRDESLAVAPAELSTSYAGFLQDGSPDVFAPSSSTTGWRETRRTTERAGFSFQYVDQPLTDGAFAPLGLRTEGGGALVFFSSKHFERQTAAEGLRPEVSADTKALLSGEVKSSLTKERVSGQVAQVPPRAEGAGSGSDTGAGGKVRILNRLPGLVAAKGS